MDRKPVFIFTQISALMLLILLTLIILCVVSMLFAAFISFVSDSAEVGWLSDMTEDIFDLLFNAHLILALLVFAAGLLTLAILQRKIQGAKTLIFVSAVNFLVLLIPTLMFYTLSVSGTQWGLG